MHDAHCECAMLDPRREIPLDRRCVIEHTAAQRGDTPPVRYECNARTCSYDDCANRRLARQDLPPLKFLDTPDDRGRGRFADCTIPAHTLIGPYYGKLIRESDDNSPSIGPVPAAAMALRAPRTALTCPANTLTTPFKILRSCATLSSVALSCDL